MRDVSHEIIPPVSFRFAKCEERSITTTSSRTSQSGADSQGDKEGRCITTRAQIFQLTLICKTYKAADPFTAGR
jgi:hypothetical protein